MRETTAYKYEAQLFGARVEIWVASRALFDWQLSVERDSVLVRTRGEKLAAGVLAARRASRGEFWRVVVTDGTTATAELHEPR